MQTTLKFGNPNAKLKALAKRFNMVLKTFSLPSGWTCPAAKECHSRADRETGKIKDGQHTQFRCFQASAEALYPSLRAMVWHNHDLLMAKVNDGHLALADLIHASLPKKFDILRVHVGGDYFNLSYLAAWCEVAKRNPAKMFYSYTKSTHLWELAEASNGIPSNLILTASRGGWFDNKIEENAYKCAEVVFSEEEAAQKGLEIDHDDSLAAFGKKSFALLLHGTQPKGSKASAALSKLRKAGKGGYKKEVRT